MASRRLWTGCASLMVVLPALSGCGSDGGGMAVQLPASPTYPTVTSGTGTLTASAAVYNSAGFTSTNPSTGSTVTSSVNTGFSPNLTISYDGASGTYTLSAITTPGGTQPLTAQYGPVQKAAAQGSGNYSASTNVNGVSTVSTLGVSGSIGGVTLTYSSIAEWKTGGTQANGSQNFSEAFVSYGVLTQAGDMPKTGTANYTLNLTGDGAGAGIGGTGSLGANFGAGTLSISLAPYYIYAQGHGALGTLTGTGTISSSASSFAATATGSGLTANIGGLFYGPQAVEVGGTFVINSQSTGFVAAGAFAGKHN